MLKRHHLSMILVTAVLAITVSCKSKPKEGEVGGLEGGAMDPSVSSQAMSFDATGSDSGKIPGLNTVRFDFDSSTLSSESRKLLADNAEWIKTNKNVTVQVEGHCDSRGSVEYNLALGDRRARAVKNYLISLGVEPKRLTIISYGEERPIATGDTEEAHAQNRRANFVPIAQ